MSGLLTLRQKALLPNSELTKKDIKEFKEYIGTNPYAIKRCLITGKKMWAKSLLKNGISTDANDIRITNNSWRYKEEEETVDEYK
tara:strand:+ start:414 stop:668 length:255 start_codon:yes stop_codon:yes gene_type:complete